MAAGLSYREGDLFAVPLDAGGYAVGLAARVNREGVIVGYFPGQRFDELPEAADLAGLGPSDAVLVKAFGDLGLATGEWPIIGQLPGWHREDWPMPVFGRREPLTGRLLRVEYADDDPNAEPREVEISQHEFEDLPENGLAGVELMQKLLSRVLGSSS